MTFTVNGVDGKSVTVSDFEGAEAADVVLAKRDKRLEKYCVEHQISCFTYENFRDICHILENEKLI